MASRAPIPPPYGGVRGGFSSHHGLFAIMNIHTLLRWLPTQLPTIHRVPIVTCHLILVTCYLIDVGGDDVLFPADLQHV